MSRRTRTHATVPYLPPTDLWAAEPDEAAAPAVGSPPTRRRRRRFVVIAGVAVALSAVPLASIGSTALTTTTANADVAGYHESSGTVHGSYRAPDGETTDAPPGMLGNLTDDINDNFNQDDICNQLRGEVENRGGHTGGWPCSIGQPRLFLAKKADGLHIQVEVPVTHLEFTYTVPAIPDPDIVASFNTYVDATVASAGHVDGASDDAPLTLTKVETTIGQTQLKTDDVLVPDSMLREQENVFNATDRVETPGSQLENGSFARVQPSIDKANQKLRLGANTVASLLKPKFNTTNSYFELQTDVDPGSGHADAALTVTLSRAFNPPDPGPCTPSVEWPGSNVVSTCTDTNSTAELRGTVDGRGDVRLYGDNNVGRGIPIRMTWQNNTDTAVSGSFYAVLSNRYGSGPSSTLNASVTGAGASSPTGPGGGDPYSGGGPTPCYTGHAPYHPVPCRHLID
jgi:hypothetical protein